MDYLTTSSDYDYSATSTTDENTYCDKTSVRDFQAMYAPILYWIVCLLGALGNLLVVGIYAHFKNRLKTMTDVYLLNLAIADLLFLFTLPFWAVSANRHWLFGTGMCKLVHFIYRINFFSCMLLLTCISVDRYFAIVQAAKAQKSKVKRLLYSKLVCIGVWLLAGLLSVPEVIFAKTRGDSEESSCELVYPAALSKSLKIFVSAMQVCVGFFIPFIVMAFCYSVIVKTLLQAKNFEKHKALKVIIAVVAVFVVSQLPYNSLLIVKAIDVANATITDCEIVKKIDIAHQVTQSIAYMHCCLNPILYAFIGVRFRNDLIKILRSVHCISQKKMNNFFSGPKRSSMLSETEVTGALSL
ncbi:C-C chemokine receptor type 9-like [Erpetoichthys calabaricus]|uniref:C-C chemokine receptor type 9-like n=1 Tax=Erpetoichthys calabaricus TaxID=27687 RepID=UPI002234937E|nr:C-C chemokine receptor type 9-like [Erpetoichthys calabaricus]XP_051785181.1 C-C chemokine receptor type 9-like [Erpetoichthys calabaricus]XP_051785182.1 C-C chemokine receptor type 9-like [Erpetoichthys calabaricus]